MAAPIDYFPSSTPRVPQVKALDFARRAFEQGFRDIVIEAPCGIGKSLISSSLALWGQDQATATLPGAPGGYVLVNQKILQDQMAADIVRFDQSKGKAALIKSAVEYPCPDHKLCSQGGPKKCAHRASGSCPYKLAKKAFLTSPLAITNYAYFMVERAFIGEIIPRRILCLDECHNLSKLILGFVDIKVSTATLEKYANADLHGDLSKIDTLPKFVDWLKKIYIPAIAERLDTVEALADIGDVNMSKEAYEVKQHAQKVAAAAERLSADTQDWVFWQQKSRGDTELNARPLEAAPYFPELIQKACGMRIYLSAYPGDRATFCKDLGLSPNSVAWISLDSPFPVDNRKVHLTTVGSLGWANKQRNLPIAMRMLRKILDKHTGVRGIIHSHSYEFAEVVVNSLAGTPHAARLICPKNADDRDSALLEHSKKPNSIIVSPSIAEGFDFRDDLARFQIILKCPFPSLGDKQVEAKMKRDGRWYQCEALKTILQAAGRIVRSEKDFGITYVLDSDAEKLLDQWNNDLPAWFTKAIVHYR